MRAEAPPKEFVMDMEGFGGTDMKGSRADSHCEALGRSSVIRELMLFCSACAKIFCAWPTRESMLRSGQSSQQYIVELRENIR